MFFQLAFDFMKPKIRLYVWGLILSVITTIMALIPPKIVAVLIDKGIIGKDHMLLIYLAILLFATHFTKSFLRYKMLVFFEISSQTMLYNLRSFLYKKLGSLDQGFYNSTSTGELMAKLTGDLDIIRHTFSWIIYNALEAVLLFVLTFIYLSTINLKLSLLLLISAPFIVLLNIFMFKKLKPVYLRARDAYTDLNSTANENISANRIVKAFVREQYEAQKMTGKNTTFKDINIEATRSWLNFGIPIEFFSSLLLIVATVGGAYFAMKGEITLGEYTIFTVLSWGLNTPLRMSGPILNDYQRFSASVQKILPLYYAKANIVEAPNPIQLDKIDGNIEFKDVSFQIDGKVLLENINLSIKSGENVAFMGETGSGKTILLSLLIRLYDPTSGVITLDGVDIKKLSFSQLRKSIGISAQDVFLFSNTIEGNIAYANPEMSTEQVQEYARIANANEFIEKMPEGYLSIIGERGVGISGGQKQRISLARALASRPNILILDDTTSAVDMETEKKILKELQKIKNCTKLIIANRISAAIHADKIVILEKGKITSMGSHKELMHKSKYYKKIYDIQHNEL